jgi:alcohol dehydrogenase (NADP+)
MSRVYRSCLVLLTGAKNRGGLGHFATMWAAALGADVTVLSHTASKKDDALKLGANKFVVTTEKDWAKPLALQYDFILSAADVMQDMELKDYFSLLKPFGRFHNVGMPDHDISLNMQMMAGNGVYIGTSHLGNRQQMESMFKLASEKNLKTWITTIPISETGCKEAVERVKKSDNVRYRLTLTGFDEVFGKRF